MFFGKIAVISIFALILVDGSDLFDRTKIEQLEITDIYFVEEKTTKSNNYTYTTPEHYRFVFEIRNRKVEMRYFSADHENYDIGDEVMVEYRLPINIFRKPYIPYYEFH